ncbi:hypothetical protein ACE10Z_23375 [Bradyrhizobium sp. Pha-3]|uniref:hypothetical protein n=1 Tax=Bradyrhizobium sp. Pha-3 TaxID=208375 RepID=UPI0035D4C106
MSLSDACFEFAETMRDAENEAARLKAVIGLLAEVAHYARAPFRYGDELMVLANGCREYLDPTTSNSDPVQRIIFLADTVREILDTPPCAKVPLS